MTKEEEKTLMRNYYYTLFRCLGSRDNPWGVTGYDDIEKRLRDGWKEPKALTKDEATAYIKELCDR